MGSWEPMKLRTLANPPVRRSSRCNRPVPQHTFTGTLSLPTTIASFEARRPCSGTREENAVETSPAVPDACRQCYTMEPATHIHPGSFCAHAGRVDCTLCRVVCTLSKGGVNCALLNRSQLHSQKGVVCTLLKGCQLYYL